MPERRAAWVLEPTDSTNSPNAVLRSSSHRTSSTKATRNNRVGMTQMLPVETNSKNSERKVGMRPPLIIRAMPRPDTIRISVAMIGWMPSTATSVPFHRPQIRPMPSVPKTMMTGDRSPWISAAMTAPLMATTEPTDRSMPREPMTIAMPMAISAGGVPR